MRARRQSASGGHWEVLGNYHRRKPSIMRRPGASYWAGVAVWRLDNALQASPRDDDDRRDHVLVQPRPGDIIGRIAIPPHSRLRDGSGRVGFAHSARRRRPCSRHGPSGHDSETSGSRATATPSFGPTATPSFGRCARFVQ